MFLTLPQGFSCDPLCSCALRYLSSVVPHGGRDEGWMPYAPCELLMEAEAGKAKIELGDVGVIEVSLSNFLIQ
jgi:hypothetical protein